MSFLRPGAIKQHKSQTYPSANFTLQSYKHDALHCLRIIANTSNKLVHKDRLNYSLHMYVIDSRIKFKFVPEIDYPVHLPISYSSYMNMKHYIVCALLQIYQRSSSTRTGSITLCTCMLYIDSRIKFLSEIENAGHL